MKHYIYPLIAFTLTIVSCSHPRPQAKTLAQLIAEDSLLKLQNIALVKKLDTAKTTFVRYMHTDEYRPLFKPTYDYMLVSNKLIDSTIRYIHNLQLFVFLVAGNNQLNLSSNVSVFDMKNPNEFKDVSKYFYSDGDSLKSVAHRLNLRIQAICKFWATMKNYSHLFFHDPKIIYVLDSASRSISTTNVLTTKDSKVVKWEEANFSNATAAEDYVFLEKLQNEILKAELIPLIYLEDEGRIKQKTKEINAEAAN